MSAAGGDATSPPRPPPSFHLLEVTVISAQDLHRRRLGGRVRAYAVAWADDAAGKMRTDVDLAGGADPTWNDRFLFRVDPGFLLSETAAVTVEVRALRRLGADAVLGSTRLVVSTFVARPASVSGAAGSSSGRHYRPTGRQVAALQLRRPRSLRPQGIVNVAVALLDAAHARTVAPICSAPGSPDAFSVKDLVTMRPAALCRIPEEDAEAGELDVDELRQPGPSSLVEHSGPLDAWGAAAEQRKLEMKLEKWKADLSPDNREDSRGGRPRRRRRASCLCGSVGWER